MVKLGGLGMRMGGFGFEALERAPSSKELADAWQPWIETCVESFGSDRCMYESNFNVDKVSYSYGIGLNAMKRREPSLCLSAVRGGVMRIASVADVKARLSSYLKASAEGPVVATRNGKAVAVLLGVEDDDELERLLLAHSRKLRAILVSAGIMAGECKDDVVEGGSQVVDHLSDPDRESSF